jgi:uncharacterized membrane protein YfcA
MIEIEALSPWLLVLVPIVVLAAYTMLGLTGFGSTMISVPILAHFLPISYLVPLMAVIDCISAASVVRKGGHGNVARRELKLIVPWMFGGFLIGLTVLVGAPDRYLRFALGIFAIAVGVHGILNPRLGSAISALWSVPAGLLGGVAASLFGAGGPIYAVYFTGRLRDKNEIRSSASMLIVISAFSRAVLYALGGLVLHLTTALGVLVCAPFVWLGLRLGTRIHVSLSQEQMRRVIGLVLLASGLSLVVRAFLQEVR